MQESIIEEIEVQVAFRTQATNAALTTSFALLERLATMNEVKDLSLLKQFFKFLQAKSRDILNRQLMSATNILVREVQDLLRFHIKMSAMSGRWNTECKDRQVLKVSFIEDVYDCLSLGEIQEFFEILSSDIDTLQQIPENEKYTLLKISNAILKRLSRTHEVEMRGRIQIFLTKLLPICHKSGLGNKKSLNDRIYAFNDQDEGSDLPYSLYKNFWSLQKYLNQPEHLVNNQLTMNEEDMTEETPDQQKLRERFKKDPKQMDQVRLANLQTIVKVISKNPLSRTTTIENRRRFPKYLTKYSLFKEQLNDGVFRKIFLTQVLLFCASQRLGKAPRNDEEKHLLLSLESECKTTLSNFVDDVSLIDELIRTEQVWLLWRERGNFEQAPSDEIYQVLKTNPNSFSERMCQKSIEKRKWLTSRIFEDSKFKPTVAYNQLLKGQRCFQVETKGIEPGLNYYLNDVLTQTDSKTVDESDRCKNMKDYSWKSVRIISKFFLRDLKTTGTMTEILDLEKLTKQIKEGVVKKLNPSNVNNAPLHQIQAIPIEAPIIPQVNPIQVPAANGNAQPIYRRPALQEQQHQHGRRN